MLDDLRVSFNVWKHGFYSGLQHHGALFDKSGFSGLTSVDITKKQLQLTSVLRFQYFTNHFNFCGKRVDFLVVHHKKQSIQHRGAVITHLATQSSNGQSIKFLQEKAKTAFI